MQKIIPFLWYHGVASQAAKLYISTFGGKMKKESTFDDTPDGQIKIYDIELFGQSFSLMSAGPQFKLNPSISFMVGCETKEEVDKYWKSLSKGGKVLMPLDKYPFSERYGWIQDKFGLSWQLILVKPEGEKRPKVVPSLLFVGDVYGKAEKAVKFYLSVFGTSKIGAIMHYGPEQGPNKEGTVMYSDFSLFGLWMAAMDGGGEHKFEFNEAVSFVVDCKDQKEVDYYWNKLTNDGGEESQCGWLKDKFGVSWQIVPNQLNEYMEKDSSGKVMQAMLKMKKLDINKLKQAYEGK